MAHHHHPQEAHGHEAHEDLAKLHVLLPHWIEHNREHAANFRAWAARAREAGREEAAAEIAGAAEQMEAANQALERALQALQTPR
ncbi:MAG: hypothetical protein H5T59_12690 [Anaerolineae bacterium]|nr:hypothetical protein [Anaerolineae bacterium]